jgi:solute carrier family 25 carnitine/acylcarnitine transporter 20/29
MNINKNDFIEFIHGFNSGIGQCIIGHPFDTYKTWIQTKFKPTITIRSLYNGFTYPTISNSIISGFAFQSYEFCKKTDPKYGMLTGGLTSGIITGILSSYFEYKKISAQLLIKSSFNYQGIITILMREIPACTAYYPVYDIMKRNNYNTFISGGIAGVTCWTVSYWADVINTNVMTGKTIKEVINTLKFVDYFRGIHVCLFRAFLINGIGFFFYDLSKNNIKIT